MNESLEDFFNAVITTESGYLLIAYGDGQGNWWENYFSYPEELPKAIEEVESKRDTYNIYFSAHLFNAKNSSKQNAKSSRTIQADLDDASLDDFIPIEPNITIETSPGRHQAYWLLSEEVPTEILEDYSRNITYSIPLCDRSGWTIGHRMRVPYTLNYKRAPIIHEIKLVSATPDLVNLVQLEQLPKASTIALEHYDQEWLSQVSTIQFDTGPLELLESIRTKLSPKIYNGYNILQEDRSAYLFALTCAAFRAELSKDQIFWLAKHTINNKFQDLKYNGDYELGKDILRAQEAVKSHTLDIRKSILSTRKQKGHPAEKCQIIANLIIEQMKKDGIFIHTSDNGLWYVRKDIGRPIRISNNSEYLKVLLEVKYGLNATEKEQHYVANALATYTTELPAEGEIAALSHLKNNQVYLHTGKSTILKISSQEIQSVNQGLGGLIFPWVLLGEEFFPTYDPSFDWAHFLFDDSTRNAIEIGTENVHALLKTWVLFILLRNLAVARPIMAFIGQPGSGKSTLFRKLYTLFYGRKRSLIGITNKEDFDQAVSSDSLVVLDGLDTYEMWLPDRLSLIASATDIIKRKLYTDNDTVTLRRQAVLGITSHNPQFTREDIADRMIVINFRRLTEEERVSESLILDEVASNRNKIWGGIIHDLQQILKNPIPIEYPSFRIEDFSRIGLWIAQGVGVEQQFIDSIASTKDSQSKLVLEEDQLLVDALFRYVAKQNGNITWESATSLWAKLALYSPDAAGFARKYKAANIFGRKLLAFSEPLKKVFDVEYKYNSSQGSRTWLIKKKGNQTND